MTSEEAIVLEIIRWALNPHVPTPYVPTPYVPTPYVPTPYVPTPYVPTPYVPTPYVPTPHIETLPEELLIERAVHHRIVGPLLSRLDAVRPAWCPPHVRTQLRIRQHRTKQTVQAQIAAAREMSRAMQEQGLAPPLFVKGFAAYALTANPDTLHDSSDLDPFAEDLPAFEAVLLELGYAGHRKDHDDWHEWGEYRRGGIALDVHQFFPNMAYPDEVHSLSAEQLVSEQNSGHWQLSSQANFRETHFGWDDLNAGATPGAAVGTEEIWFPSPAALCIIHCAHSFRLCMNQMHYMDMTGTFRLYELLSVFHLARLPSFDTNQFNKLRERFLAQDAVHFINTLAMAILGEILLPEQHDRPHWAEDPLCPERLFDGGWVALQPPEDWLFVRRFEPTLGRLGVNVLPAHSILEISRFPRLLTYGLHIWASQQLEIAWEEAAETLTLLWHLDHPADTPAYYRDLQIHFEFGSCLRVNFGWEWEVSAVEQRSDAPLPDRPATAEMQRSSDRSTLRLVCPVPRHPRQAGVLSLLLGLFRKSEDGEAAAYLPLQLVR